MMSSQKTQGSTTGLRCRECGKELIDPTDQHRFNDRRLIKGQLIKTHWYLCSSCALELTCKDCGKELIDSTDRYKFNYTDFIEGKVTQTYKYLCRSCALEAVTPNCENKECSISKPGDPELRIKKLAYDPLRWETWCKDCGLVQEEVSITSLSGISSVQYPRPKEPKDYIQTVQELANDCQVDWFNYTEQSLIITCKETDTAMVAGRYPDAELIII